MSRIYYEIRTKTDAEWECEYYPSDKYTEAEALEEAKKEAPGCEVELAGKVIA